MEYCITPDTEEPIMLLEGVIGRNPDTGEGVSGARFCQELLFLDTLKKSRIQVWINSPGGSIMDADLITSTILKTSTKVDTYNMGTCASSAGAVFMAGRNRYMMDHAKFMIHGVSGAEGEALKAFTDGIVKNLTARSKMSEEQVRAFMSTETWLNASECEAFGIAKVEHSNALNKPHANATNWKDFTAVVNELKEKVTKTDYSNNMKNIANRLQLNESASESAIVSEIEKIENRAKTAEGKLASQEAENKAKIEAVNKELTEAKNKLAEIENKAKEATEAALKAKNEALAAEAKAAIAKAVTEGRIENKAEIITKWETRYVANSADAIELLSTLPANKTMPKNTIVVTGTGPTGGEDKRPSIDVNNPTMYTALRNAQNYNSAVKRFGA